MCNVTALLPQVAVVCAGVSADHIVMLVCVCVVVCMCAGVLAIVVHGDVPPWLYMHVFFAVGFPKEHALGTLVPR